MLPLILLLGACSSPPDPAELWARECASCHAVDGRGDPRKVPLAPGLNLHRSQIVLQAARGPMYRIVRQGFGSMPGFDHRLEHEEIEALVEYMVEMTRASAELNLPP